MALIWLGEPMISCKSGKRKNDRSIFDERATFHDSDDLEFLRFDLDRIADFFLEHFRRGLAQDHRLFRGIVRHASGDQFKIVPAKSIPIRARKESSGPSPRCWSPRTSRLQVAAMCGRLAIRSRTEASNGFGVSAPTLVADDDVGPARLQSNLPAFLKAARHPDQRHDRSDADGNSAESQAGAHRTAQETAEDNGEEGHGLLRPIDDSTVFHAQGFFPRARQSSGHE